MTDRYVRPARSPVIPVALWSCGAPADVPEAPPPDVTVPDATESPAEADADTASEPRGLRVNTSQTSPGYVLFNPLLSRTTVMLRTVCKSS